MTPTAESPDDNLPSIAEAGWRGPILITGTDTGVGKTITTAAIAAAAAASGLCVAVLKPAQTGDDDDASVIAQLAEPHTVRTLAYFPDPLAPLTAARVAQLPALTLSEVTHAIDQLNAHHDLVLVEGAGGLLVPLGAGGWTLRDLARAQDLPVVVVARAGLGTLNHTALTLEALSDRPTAVVIGAWPSEPKLVHRENLRDLPGKLAGVIPERVGEISPDAFRTAAPGWLTSQLHGRGTLPGNTFATTLSSAQ